jgi:hypothetical protein
MSYFKRAPTTFIDLQMTLDDALTLGSGAPDYALTPIILPGAFLPEEIVFVELLYVRQRVKNQFAAANDITGGKVKIYNNTTTTYEEIGVVAYNFARTDGPMSSLEEINGIKTFFLDLSMLSGVWSDYFTPGASTLFSFTGIVTTHDSIQIEGHIQARIYTR